MSDLPSLFDSEKDDLPLPLIVAEKWEFPLAHMEIEGQLFYAVQDWLRGLTGSDNIRRIWSDMQRADDFSQMYDSIVPHRESRYWTGTDCSIPQVHRLE